MSAAVSRIEEIARSDTAAKHPRKEKLAAEFAGMKRSELAARREMLNHIELLIADWKLGGCVSYDAENVFNAIPAGDVAPYELNTDVLGNHIVFINFGPSSALDLTSSPGVRIEGLYLREAYSDGEVGLEVTLVCDEPAWSDFGSMLFKEAIRKASRATTGFISLCRDHTPGLTLSWTAGDPSILQDPTLEKVVATADLVLAILTSIHGPSRCPEPWGLRPH